MSIKDKEIESLEGCVIGVDLHDGRRIVGKVHKWDKSTIWIIDDKTRGLIDIPRNISVRALVVLENKEDE